MRSPRTLSRYVAREVVTYSSLGLFAITTVMVTQNLFRFLDEIIAARATWADCGIIIGYLCLMLATYTVPIAFLLGVLLALGRLAADSEITAMQSCGLGLPSLFRPLVILGILAAGLTAFLIVDVEHRAHLALRQVVKMMVVRGGFIEPGKFRQVGDLMLFVQDVGSTNQLSGIVISDRTDADRPLMIFAEHGDLNWNDEKNQLEFQLRRGGIHVEPSRDTDNPLDGSGRYQRLSFQSFDYRVKEKLLFGESFSVLRPREMTIGQLSDVVAYAEAGGDLNHLRRNDPVKYQLQIQRRIALPFAPLLFAFIGGALGLTPRRGTRSWAAFLCTSLVFGYYSMLSIGEMLAVERVISPYIALWIPNVAFSVAAVFLLVRARRLPV